ncbi:hypothetical protein [Novosphingobium colocasiae]|uniref:Uncharacterized protein n=1 Tax=Novosphingobium colocasiae TaxID=1256513 RepID=A0A918PE76_9SPHN|nr:hypothetical protein [Novosphingobium colocasiae]GGZ02546.1 hypothetical protein GCM10011614_17020 [Novosphingobium colocasiae]
MSNYSTLQRNTLAGLSETAGALYLTLLDVFQGHTRDGERKAFLAACDYDKQVGSTLDRILRHMPGAPGPMVHAQLSAFFADRWRYNFMPLVKAQ